MVPNNIAQNIAVATFLYIKIKTRLQGDTVDIRLELTNNCYLHLPTSSSLTEVVINAYGGAVDGSMCSFESILVFVLSLPGPRNN